MNKQPAKIMKIFAAGACSSDTKSAVAVRQHNVLADEPIQQGGTDAGPNPIELLASAFIGCTNVIANKIAAEIGVSLRNLKIDVTFDLDLRVLTGQSIPAVFPTIHLNVSGQTDGTPKQINVLSERLATSCPISVLVRQAGSDVIENWNIGPID